MGAQTFCVRRSLQVMTAACVECCVDLFCVVWVMCFCEPALAVWCVRFRCTSVRMVRTRTIQGGLAPRGACRPAVLCPSCARARARLPVPSVLRVACMHVPCCARHAVPCVWRMRRARRCFHTRGSAWVCAARRADAHARMRPLLVGDRRWLCVESVCMFVGWRRAPRACFAHVCLRRALYSLQQCRRRALGTDFRCSQLCCVLRLLLRVVLRFDGVAAVSRPLPPRRRGFMVLA